MLHRGHPLLPSQALRLFAPMFDLHLPVGKRTRTKQKCHMQLLNRTTRCADGDVRRRSLLLARAGFATRELVCQRVNQTDMSPT